MWTVITLTQNSLRRWWPSHHKKEAKFYNTENHLNLRITSGIFLCKYFGSADWIRLANGHRDNQLQRFICVFFFTNNLSLYVQSLRNNLYVILGWLMTQYLCVIVYAHNSISDYVIRLNKMKLIISFTLIIAFLAKMCEKKLDED